MGLPLCQAEGGGPDTGLGCAGALLGCGGAPQHPWVPQTCPSPNCEHPQPGLWPLNAQIST